MALARPCLGRGAELEHEHAGHHGQRKGDDAAVGPGQGDARRVVGIHRVAPMSGLGGFYSGLKWAQR